jgi:hypothetical protein
VVTNLIDVWDTKTFDEELDALLTRSSGLIRNYVVTENCIFVEYDRGRGDRKLMTRPNNPYAAGFLSLKEDLAKLMRERVIRAWHYTRLTEKEVEQMLKEGLHLSTPATLRSRLNSLVQANLLTSDRAETLYAASPFHSNQLDGRSGKFWVVSHPTPVSDSGVERLLAHWGGEVASFWTEDPALIAGVRGIGQARVLELAIPLAITEHTYSAAQAVAATFGQMLGCVVKQHAFDAYVTSALSPGSIVQVHSEGEPSFSALGVGYPAEYVDADEDYWQRLTGEE